MCAIVGSFSPDKLKELVKLNSYRGNFSYSLCAINDDNTIESLKKDFGVLTADMIDSFTSEFKGKYYLGHIQAPTGGLIEDTNRIHPATNTNYYMWHNGILKHKYIEELQTQLKSKDEWDTALLLQSIVKNGLYEAVKEVDGTFSCVMLNTSMLLFRNEDSPMFYDAELNISSSKFDGSVSTLSNSIYEVYIDTKEIVYICTWTPTHVSPYFFG